MTTMPAVFVRDRVQFPVDLTEVRPAVGFFSSDSAHPSRSEEQQLFGGFVRPSFCSGAGSDIGHRHPNLHGCDTEGSAGRRLLAAVASGPDNPYRSFPRPADSYYEARHDLLGQGDVIQMGLWGVLGPELLSISPKPEGVEIPEGTEPILFFLRASPFGLIVGNTCSFRHPSAAAVAGQPAEYSRPGTIYHSGQLHVAPVRLISDVPEISKNVLEEMVAFDHLRRYMYLPPSERHGIPECVADLDRADLVSLDLVGRADRLAQLTVVGRQQLARKLVYHATGDHTKYEDWDPDMT